MKKVVLNDLHFPVCSLEEAVKKTGALDEHIAECIDRAVMATFDAVGEDDPNISLITFTYKTVAKEFDIDLQRI